MTNLEKALHWAETLIQQTDEHLPCCSPRLEAELIEQRSFAVTALDALQEKLARENGCEWCAGNTEWQPDLLDGCVGGYRKPKFCPVCGRKLRSGEHE